MRWTKEEKQFLIDNFVEKGKSYCAESLGRSINAINVAASRLNLTFDQRKPWSTEEIHFLTLHYTSKGCTFCTKELDRTFEAVQRKAYLLGLANKRWSSKEVEFLVTHYAEKGPAHVAEKLNRGYEEVSVKASRLGLKANTNYKKSNIVYVFYFPELLLFKVGVTNCVERRSNSFMQKCEVLGFTEYSTHQEAAKVERELLNSVLLVNTGKLKNGNTETFTEPTEKVLYFLRNTYVQPDLFSERPE